MAVSSPIKVAMIGSKGLPAVFGGIERHVEEVGKRLALKGHEITVFGRKPFSTGGEHLGMKVKVLPSIPTKNLETATNSFAATLSASSSDFDIIHYHGIGPSIFSWIPSLFGKTTVATIHAPDYRQSKWGPAARFLLRQGERTAMRRCTAVIAVSRLMAGNLATAFNRKVRYIPNGAAIIDIPPINDISRFGLEREGYILTVGRFIYERGFHTLLEAYKNIETDKRLVIVGDARFEERYAAGLGELADERVLFAGYISGRPLDELYAHCAFYVLPSLVEGLPISLLEAMSFARPVLVSDIPENLEVAEDIGLTFKTEDRHDLARALRLMLEMNDEEKREMGGRGRERVERNYTWDMVTDQLEELYLELCASK